MLRKRTLLVTSLICSAVALMLGATVGAQVVQGSKIIERLTGDTRGGWVKIDKSPGKPGHERVYCITIDAAPSCDWSDVRLIAPDARISRR